MGDGSEAARSASAREGEKEEEDGERPRAEPADVRRWRGPGIRGLDVVNLQASGVRRAASWGRLAPPPAFPSPSEKAQRGLRRQGLSTGWVQAAGWQDSAYLGHLSAGVQQLQVVLHRRPSAQKPRGMESAGTERRFGQAAVAAIPVRRRI